MNERAKKITFLVGSFALVFLIATIFMHSWLLYALKKSQAFAIQRVVKEHILLGDKREVLAVLNQVTSFGFSKISVDSKGYSGNIVVKSPESSRWNRTIAERIYFDAKNQYEAGEIIFSYSIFEGFVNALVVWVFITLMVSIPIRFVVDRQISAERQKAEASRNREVLAILNSLAHDIRAPLGVFEKLLFMPDTATLKHEKASIQKAFYRLNSLIESLRRSDTEAVISTAVYRFDVQEGLGLLKHKAEERNIKVQSMCTDNITVRADAGKVERAWVNLALNAIDFAKSQIRVEVGTEGDELVIQIIDDGPGVAPEMLPRLFQRGATHGKPDGTGLGLAYVRQIMRGHGGDVTYRRENNLTIFECRLPNAVLPEKEQVVVYSALLEPQLVQKQVCFVAICLEPRALTQSILAKLASYDSGDILFSEERDRASIVVSNMDDVMFEVLERDDQEYMSLAHSKGDENAIMMVLRRKFNLEKDGSHDV
jgi:signal transduction histidine kinase